MIFIDLKNNNDWLISKGWTGMSMMDDDDTEIMTKLTDAEKITNIE